MSEAFNSVTVESRAKPLMIMLEEIRTYIMENWTSNMMGFPYHVMVIFYLTLRRKWRESTHRPTYEL